MNLTGQIDCIIPYHNEGSRVTAVVQTALNTPHIRRVICVDDGSLETNIGIPWLKHRKLIYLQHPTNFGKTHAIRTGLAAVETAYVLLLDADLVGLRPMMLTACIRYVVNTGIDLFVVRCQKVYATTRLLRLDVLLSGERIIRTETLRNILREPLYGYQLETAINRHFRVSSGRLAYADLPISQFRKQEKVGCWVGIWQEIQAARQVIAYRGLGELVRQMLSLTFEKVKLGVPLDNLSTSYNYGCIDV